MPRLSNSIPLRSEEVKEILTAVPNWMIRWGNSLILILIFGLLSISWFVKYPDTIEAKALITTRIPPQKEYAKTSCQIDTFLVNDNQKVEANTPLAIIENSANFNDVSLLKSIIDTIRLQKEFFAFPIQQTPLLSLGDIMTDFILFQNNYDLYQLKQHWQPARKTKINQNKEEQILLRNVIQSFNQLKKAIKDWESKYVLKASIAGQVSFLDFGRVNQTIKTDDLIFMIIPINNKEYRAKLRLPALNSGKVKTGQTVNIRLENYPDMEYGLLKGKIDKVSTVTDKDGAYIIEVILPANLITNYGKTIRFKQEMHGIAEIITEELRLTERFFYQFKKVLQK